MADVELYDPPQMQLVFDPQSDERSPWVTACPHKFANGVYTLTVPAGFRCDLASVPGPLLWLFGPNGRHQRAALFHDAGYRLKPTKHRATIDAAFYAMMQDDGVSWWKATLMYLAVRLCGRTAWKGLQ